MFDVPSAWMLFSQIFILRSFATFSYLLMSVPYVSPFLTIYHFLPPLCALIVLLLYSNYH